MTLQSLELKLRKVKRQAELLERRIEAQSKKQFAALPPKVGLKTIDELIERLLPHASPGYRSRLGAGGTSQSTTRGRRPGKSKGTRYPVDIKAKVKQALASGKTADQVSKEFGPSVFSISAWKKQWGMTKSRRKRSTSNA